KALGFVQGDAELAGEGEGSLPVNRGEVDGLGARPDLGGDLLLGHAEDERRGLSVNIPAPLERLHERRVAGEMGEQPQLDLGVVGGEQHRTGRSDERASNIFAARRANGDIRAVRVRGREPARRGARLVEARVDASGPRVDIRGQRVHVRGLELRQLAVFDQQLGHLVPHHGQLLQDFEVCRGTGLGFLENRKLVLFEQNVAELRRRVNVEFRAGGMTDGTLELRELACDRRPGSNTKLASMESYVTPASSTPARRSTRRPYFTSCPAFGTRASSRNARTGASASLASGGRLRGAAPPASSPSGATWAKGRYHERPGATARDIPTSSARIGSGDVASTSKAASGAARHSATAGARATRSSRIVGS